MKYVHPTIISLPTIFILAVIAYGIFTGKHLFYELGIPVIAGFLPVATFPTCVALVLVFPNAKEWKAAAVINGVPLLLVGLIMLFFALVGYNG